MLLKCHHCQTEFKHSRDKKFCSDKCYRESIKVKVNLTCQQCGKSFRGYKTRKYCSRVCSDKSKLIYTDAQINFLEKHVGRQPIQIIVSKFVEKYPNYTRRQVEIKISQIAKTQGISTICKKSVVQRGELARILGVTLERIRSWSRNNNLPVIKLDHSDKKYISIRDFNKFAINHPELFKSISIAKIRKISRNQKVIEALISHCSLPGPQDLVIVRLDQQGVYESAKSASRSLNCKITDKGILYNCSKDKPMQNGCDWYKLQYPCLEVPIAIKQEFLFYAGHIFYELYLGLKNIDGYQKSCLIVAARNAIAITLSTYKKQFRQELFGKPIEPKLAIAHTLKERILQSIKFFYKKPESNCFQIIKSRVVQLSRPIFMSRTKSDKFVEDFALDFIAEQSRYFFKSFIPKDYEPRTSLEKADYFQSQRALAAYARVYWNSGKTTLMCHIKAHKYIDKNGLAFECIYDDNIEISNTELSDFPRVEAIINNLMNLNINDELKSLARKYISTFIDTGSIEESCIPESKVSEVIEVLQRCCDT